MNRPSSLLDWPCGTCFKGTTVIKFLDLKAVNEPYVPDIKRAVDRVLESGWYLLGRELEAFETAFAHYCGLDHAVGLASGLDALKLSLQACGLGQGDEVLVPANTYIATVLAVTACGAEPVFVEPDPDTHLIDLAALEDRITDKTKAVIPVHLYGRMCDMDRLARLAQRYGFRIIEDAAQAHGAARAQRDDVSPGPQRVMAFSFYPSKNLGALADAGAVATNDGELAERLRALRNYGSQERYYNHFLGINSRMDEMQAAVLSIKLTGLDADNAKRRRVADYYLENIRNERIVLPRRTDRAEDHVWHVFVVRAQKRDQLRQYLLDHGIQSLIHYPVPPHKQKCYPQYNELSLPVAEQLSAEVLSLPMSPALQDGEMQKVVRVLNEWR